MTDSTNSKSPVSVSLRPVTDADREFLIAVYDSTGVQELAQVAWEEGQREAFVRWQFERQDEEYRQRFPNARYEVILVDGVPAGRIWIGMDQKQIRLLDIGMYHRFSKSRSRNASDAPVDGRSNSVEQGVASHGVHA